MPSYEAPPDDGDHAPRQTYNFAPGYNGIVYRADVPDHGAGHAEETEKSNDQTKEVRYKLQSMRWGLIPFWTKRSPDYSSMIKTINCRDDSLATSKGLWNSIKPKKRCIVVAQGFYEWLKDPHNPKMKTPHYVKRKDGQLLCMAGLWDCVQYEGAKDKLYSYTVITTDSNKQLKFLHDRMPVILDNGGEEIRTWLDPERFVWNKELQSLLRPYEGELDVYPVSKEVGKVGNNSERFIIPVDSVENKANIANFFGNTKSAKSSPDGKIKKEDESVKEETEIKNEPGESRTTIDHEGTEDNAPIPIPKQDTKRKRKHDAADDDDSEEEPASKTSKTEQEIKTEPESPTKKKGTADSETKQQNPSPSTRSKSNQTTKSTNLRSSTSNGSVVPSPTKGKDKGSLKITSFFSK